MPEMHLRQLGVTYSACGPFAKNKERIQKIEKAGDSRRRTAASEKLSRDNAFNVAFNFLMLNF